MKSNLTCLIIITILLTITGLAKVSFALMPKPTFNPSPEVNNTISIQPKELHLNELEPSSISYLSAQVKSTSSSSTIYLTEYTLDMEISFYLASNPTTLNTPLTYSLYKASTYPSTIMSCTSPQKCSINATLTDQLITSGELSPHQKSLKITSPTLTILTNETQYYFLILECPNQDSESFSDASKSLQFSEPHLTILRTIPNSSNS